MSLIKKLIYVLLLIILIVVLAVAALMVLIDPNQLKPVITKEVMKRSGYKLVIDGNLSWSLFPVLGVKAERMLVYRPGGKQALLDLKSVRVATDPWLLLKGEQKLQGDVYISSAKLDRLNTQNIRVGIAWQGKVLTLHPIQARFYQGELSGDFSASQLDQTPVWRWHLNLKNFAIKPMIQDLSAIQPRITMDGKASFSMHAQASGIDEMRVLSSMKGKANFEVLDGQLLGINLPYFVESAEALIRKQAIPMPPSKNDTDFGRISASAVIDEGIAKSTDLLIEAPEFSTSGEGMVDLVKQTMNYELMISPRKGSRAKWQVPVLVKGALDNPNVTLDAAALNTLIFKQQLGDITDKVQKEVKKQIKNLPEQADKFLKGLTGQD